MRYAFTSCVLDTDSFEFSRHGTAVSLQPKVFALLRHLIEQRARAVSKAELLETLWPAEHVSDTAITWCVHQLRRALGQARGDNRPIATIPRRGYRFVERVQEDAPIASAGPVRAEARAPDARLVGHVAARHALRAALDAVRAGQGGVYLLTGEAGIGKTRCLLELANQAAALELTSLSARCFEDESAPAFWPWIEILRAATQSDRLSVATRDEARALVAILAPSFGSLGRAVAPRRRDAARFTVLTQLCEWVARCAASGPLILFLDDLHWADDESVRVVTRIADDIRALPVLLVGSARDPLVPDASLQRPLARLRRQSRCLPLRGFSRDEVQAYLATLSVDASERLASEILRRTGGNPLFVKETAHALIDTFGRAALPTLEPDAVTLSGSARQLMRERLIDCSARLRSLLQIAAVAGDAFELCIAQAALGLTRAQTLTLLRRAEDGRWLVQRGSDGRYAFTHDVLRELVFDALSASARRAAHLQIGGAIAARYASAPPVATLAFHFHRALPEGDIDRAIACCRAAADAAFWAYAFDDAARIYRWALDALAVASNPDPALRCELLLSLAGALGPARRVEENVGAVEEATRIARDLGRADLLLGAAHRRRPPALLSRQPDEIARAALEQARKLLPNDEAKLRSLVLGQLARIPPYAESAACARELSLEAVALARPFGGDTLLEALRARLFAAGGPDELDELIAIAHELLAQDDAPSRGWAAMEAQFALFLVHATRGEAAAIDDAIESFGRAAAAVCSREGAWYHDYMLALRALQRGDFARAEHAHSELSDRAERLGLPYAQMFRNVFCAHLEQERDDNYVNAEPRAIFVGIEWRCNDGYRAWSAFRALEAGDSDVARKLLDEFVARRSADDGHDRDWLWSLVETSRLAIALGGTCHAFQLYESLAPYGRHYAVSKDGHTSGSVARYLGLLAHCLGNSERALRHLEEAVGRNQRAGLWPQAVRTKLDLARLLAGDARAIGRALAQFDECEASARALGMGRLADRARTAARAIRVQSSRTPKLAPLAAANTLRDEAE